MPHSPLLLCSLLLLVGLPSFLSDQGHIPVLLRHPLSSEFLFGFREDSQDDISSSSRSSADGQGPISPSFSKFTEGVGTEEAVKKIGEAVVAQLQGSLLKHEEGMGEDTENKSKRANGRDGRRSAKGRVMIALTEGNHKVTESVDERGSIELLEMALKNSANLSFVKTEEMVNSGGHDNPASTSNPSIYPPSSFSDASESSSPSHSPKNTNIHNNLPSQIIKSYQILPEVGIIIVDFHPLVNEQEVSQTVRTLWEDHPDVWMIEADTKVTFRGEDVVEERIPLMGQARLGTPLYARQPTANLTIPNDDLFEQQWGLRNLGSSPVDVRAVGAWSLIYDQAGNRKVGRRGLMIGHIDTGCDIHHPDLARNVWVNPGEIPDNGIDDDGNGFIDDIHGWNFDADNNDVTDEHGHGTHTAGILSASSNNREGIAGMIWDAKIVVLKFKNYVSDAIAAIEYCLGMGIQISTNSWGFNAPAEGLRLVLQRANQRRHMFVCAVDNKGRDNTWFDDFPPNYPFPNMIRVASINSNAELESSSDYSRTKVDIAAPGKGVLSSVPKAVYGTEYALKDGTSMATPLVAGLLALLMSVQPGVDIYWARKVVLDTVTPLTAIKSKTLTGGIINSENAVKSLLGIPFVRATPISPASAPLLPLNLFLGPGPVTEIFSGFNSLVGDILTRSYGALKS